MAPYAMPDCILICAVQHSLWPSKLVCAELISYKELEMERCPQAPCSRYESVIAHNAMILVPTYFGLIQDAQLIGH